MRKKSDSFASQHSSPPKDNDGRNALQREQKQNILRHKDTYK